MRTFGTVIVESLHIHVEPGGKIIGHLDQNVRVELEGEAIVHPGATWWKLKGRDGYAAEKNKAGAVFMHIEKLAPPPQQQQPFPTWWVVAAIGVIVAALLAMYWS